MAFIPTVHRRISRFSRLNPSNHFQLLLPLLKRELRDRYVGTGGGLAWALIQPVLMLAAYAFVFSYVFNIRIPGADGPLAYTAFVAAALWPWFLFQEGLLRSLSALRGQSTLVRKTQLPRDLPVNVAVLSTACVHLFGYGVVLVCLVAVGAPFFTSGLPLLFLTLVTLVIALLAIGQIASVAQLVWRDLDHALQPALMLLFYATPILYPLSLVPTSMQDWVAGNPMAWCVERIRAALFTGALPDLADLGACATAILLLLACRHCYLRVARQAEDLL